MQAILPTGIWVRTPFLSMTTKLLSSTSIARVSSHDQKDDLERQKQMLEIITGLYGSRSHKNRKLIEGMKEAVEAVDAAGA